MTTFRKLADTFAALEKTRSRLQMVQLLAALFDEVTKNEIQPAIYLVQGRLGPSYDAPDFGISEKLTTRVVAQLLGRPQTDVEADNRKLGDHGLVVEKLLGKKKTSLKAGTTRLTIPEVYERLTELARAAGQGSVEQKINALVTLLQRASPLEGSYLLRIPMGRMRLGVGDATILDGLSRAKGVARPIIERGYNLSRTSGSSRRRCTAAASAR